MQKSSLVGVGAALSIACHSKGPVPPSAAVTVSPDRVPALHVEAGHVSRQAEWLHIDDPGVRVVTQGSARTTLGAQVDFVFRGASHDSVPLASGEMRRQIGLKLRAQDTCNVVYVMWHIEPSPGVFVSVKRNEGAATHEACGAGGYVNVKNEAAASMSFLVRKGERHSLRAELEPSDARVLRVYADDVLAWSGVLPREALAFDGPSGLRTDNGAFDARLVVRP